jgi:hypothetical protein
MQRYRDVSGDSGVSAYETGPQSITVRFKDGGTYLYDASIPGKRFVTAMKKRAAEGKGLATYINRHVRERYAARLK